MDRWVVSAVIPSQNRPELRRAIESVLAQSCAEKIEIVLVFDLAPGSVEPPVDLLRPSDKVLWTAGSQGGSTARNVGVDAAAGEWVAFLDDDDTWSPSKIEKQLERGRTMLDDGLEPVIACRHQQADVRSGHTSQPVPKVAYDGQQTVAEYLFAKRRPAGGRASIYTSTLMCRRSLALREPWDPSLARHQDWDWIIRLETSGGARISQLDEPLVTIYSGSAGSISAGTNWAGSLAWADSVLPAQAPGVYEDFIVAQTLRYAVAARSMSGIRAVVARLRSRRRLPSWGPAIIACAGLIPRKSLESLMARVR